MSIISYVMGKINEQLERPKDERSVVEMLFDMAYDYMKNDDTYGC